jgi:hypothetical protein
MAKKTSIRELRTAFPKVRAIVEEEGSVIVCERGKPRYVLSSYKAASKKKPPAVDYWKRLCEQQPVALDSALLRKLDDENRGDR